MRNNLKRRITTRLTSLLLLTSGTVGYDLSPNKDINITKENTAQNLGAEETSNKNNDLEAKLEKLKVFDAGDLKVPEGFDITADALKEGKGALVKLGEIVDESYGRKPLVLKLGTTWCGPCRASYQEFVEFANEHPEIETAHLIMDRDIVGEDVMAGIRLAYGWAGSVPNYVVIDKAGRQIGEETVYSLKAVVNFLENPPRGNNDSDIERAETLALARGFVKEHPVPVDSDQITIVDGSTVLRNNYEVLEFLAGKTGKEIPWTEESENLAKDTYTYLAGDITPSEALSKLAERWEKRVENEREFITLASVLNLYKGSVQSSGETCSIKQALELGVRGEERKRFIYTASDFFDLIQEKTGLEVRASDEIADRSIIFTTHGGSATDVLSHMFIEDRHDIYRVRMYDMGESKNPVLILQKRKR